MNISLKSFQKVTRIMTLIFNRCRGILLTLYSNPEVSFYSGRKMAIQKLDANLRP